jgi:hypothetical protein
MSSMRVRIIRDDRVEGLESLLRHKLDQTLGPLIPEFKRC